MDKDKFVLNHGCHKGTLVSRDNARSEKFDTEKEARDRYLKHKYFYESIGYQIWFAKITCPNGKEIHLESNPYY
jgi:hypothetical protein